ncbi:hypothetical protein [Fuscovulum blasticum]|uniref:hypothetical protein n=1 Tax=Fuscovulum blasticum TaxID=1075 RepID=UPI000D3E74F3|nr:hypothetical protein [Fuscovulum blasticum]AWD21596.1 hypothetical protein B6K69_07845 [Fuscovulum blasticum]
MVMRSIRASASDVRAAWLDPELTLCQAAESVGMSKDALQARAALLGLPARRTGRREVIRPHHEAEFRLMWKAGVAAREIGDAFGCSYFAVINTAARLGLVMRGAGFRPRLALSEFREIQLRVSMETRVQAEQQMGAA